MGVRLHFAPARSWCQDSAVLRWIAERYQIPFLTPPLTCRPAPFRFLANANDTYRSFFNVSMLFVYIVCTHFKRETVHAVCASVHPSVWTFSFEFKAAYLQVPFHPGSFR